MSSKCIHSCRGLCNALKTAEKHESESLSEYQQFNSECDYPDVRTLLDELIVQKRRTLSLLKEKRAMLEARIGTLNDIMESF